MASFERNSKVERPMRTRTNTEFRIWIYVAVALGCATALVIVYASFVGAASSFTISTNDENWANFADYLAGTLGPALSFLAFIAVLWTVSLQKMQLDLMQESRVLEEMQRLLANLYDSIQTQLREDISNRFQSDDLRKSGFSLYKTLIAYAETLTQHAKLPRVPTHEAQFAKEAKSALAMPAVALAYELTHFTRALNRYASLNGSPDVIDYYVHRFRHIVSALKASEITNIPEQMIARFCPITPKPTNESKAPRAES